MRCVIQRVSGASVSVDGRVTGEIGPGCVALLGVEADDTDKDTRYCAEKLAGLRIFEDEQGKMNRSILDTGGAVLAISQFTLCADVRHGRRPSFTGAARPEEAVTLYEEFCQSLRAAGLTVAVGVFQAHMAVSLVNDGPVTILLDSRKAF